MVLSDGLGYFLEIEKKFVESTKTICGFKCFKEVRIDK